LVFFNPQEEEKGGVMTKSKRVMRRQILSLLYDRLQNQSYVFYARETFLSGELSLHDIDAMLAFRSDPCLEELRHALDRLDSGTYGMCLGCKSSINQDALDAEPTRRICSSCEEKFVHVAPSPYFHAHVTS
jgi:hypothetical protein